MYLTMIKNLAALALVVPLVATSVSALERETSEENTIANQESQNLYPLLKGDEAVAIEIVQPEIGLYVVKVQYSTDENVFVRYTYGIRKMVRNSIFLTYPRSVEIDRDGNHQFGKDEFTDLGSETSEKLKSKKPAESFQENPLYPYLRGDDLVSLGFAELPEGLIAFMEYSSKSNNPINVIYAHEIIFKEGEVYLREPYKAFFDFDDNGTIGDGEVFDLREEPEKKGWNI